MTTVYQPIDDNDDSLLSNFLQIQTENYSRQQRVSKALSRAQNDNYDVILSTIGIDSICDCILRNIDLELVADNLKISLSNLLKWIRSDTYRKQQVDNAFSDLAKVLRIQAVDRVVNTNPKNSIQASHEKTVASTLLRASDSFDPPINKVVSPVAINLNIGFATPIAELDNAIEGETE